MAFYNTIRLSGSELSRAQAREMNQRQLVLALFRFNPDKRFSPSQIYTLFRARYGNQSPITSWRRTLTDLTSEGLLIKGTVAQQVLGPNGRPEHTWAYNEAGDTRALEGFMEDLQEWRLENREKCSEVSPQATLSSPSEYTGKRDAAPAKFIQQALFAY
jgi:hypothetical protein